MICCSSIGSVLIQIRLDGFLFIRPVPPHRTQSGGVDFGANLPAAEVTCTFFPAPPQSGHFSTRTVTLPIESGLTGVPVTVHLIHNGRDRISAQDRIHQMHYHSNSLGTVTVIPKKTYCPDTATLIALAKIELKG